jgi:hypothetical protein
MKAIKVLFTSLFVVLVVNSFAFGQAESPCKRWNGPNNSKDYIWREGPVGIGELRLLLNNVADGTKILRGGAGDLRMQYENNVFFDALKNGSFQIRNKVNEPVFSVNPIGHAYFNNSGNMNVGLGTTNPTDILHIHHE